jgi:murein DD-endopeptidase MepM/ murein hydrolase activator NlpD
MVVHRPRSHPWNRLERRHIASMTLSRRRAAAMLSAAVLVTGLVLTGLVASPLPAGAALPAASGWPLEPRPEVVRGFEPPPKPWLAGHRGLDLAGSPGQRVLSATPGTITYAGPVAGVGVVVVSQGPIRTTYEPVVASVRTGATVKAGQPIGRLSAAGSHCSPAVCLHWGLRRGEEYLDPLSLLTSGPVRLLPLSQPAPTRDRNVPPPTLTSVAVSAAEVGAGRNGAGAGDGGGAAAIVVGLAALGTVGGGLLIRRH